MEHAFTQTIKAVLQKHFGAQADELFERSLLLQYLNVKTRAANRGSKSRSSFANLYALYVLAEHIIAAYDVRDEPSTPASLGIKTGLRFG